jgi:trafficking protein particle complex subunit 8
MSLLPITEKLNIRGRRLHATPEQRQGKVYAPDVPISVEIEDAALRLSVSFVDDGPLALFEGETKSMQLWLSNEGTKEIAEIFLVAGQDDEIFLVNQTSSSSECAFCHHTKSSVNAACR